MRKTLVIDDFDGKTTDGVRQVTVIVDNQRWNLDLGAESLKALKDALKPFTKNVDASKLETRTRRPGNVRRPGINTWLRDNGYPDAKGRPSAEQQQAYDDAH